MHGVGASSPSRMITLPLLLQMAGAALPGPRARGKEVTGRGLKAPMERIK